MKFIKLKFIDKWLCKQLVGLFKGMTEKLAVGGILLTFFQGGGTEAAVLATVTAFSICIILAITEYYL